MALARVSEAASSPEELHRLCLLGSSDKVAEFLDTLPEGQIDSATVGPDGQPGDPAFHLAARGGHLLITQALLHRGANPNVLDAHGRTALHLASLEGHADLVLELIMGRVDVNALDMMHETALHKAVLADKSEALEMLLDHGGADPTIKGGAGVTPALLAAEHGALGPLQALVARNPDLVHAQNDAGWTPLHLAAHGDQHQRKVTTSKPAKFHTVVQLLLETKADVGARDEDTKTPLHRAAATGNADVVAALAAAGADVAAADICRWTPLHYAVQDGHLKVMQVLISARAAVQTPDPVCLTPLAIATLENQVKAAELLMSHNADPNLRGKGLASPLMIARKEKDKYSDLLALFELGFVAHH